MEDSEDDEDDPQEVCKIASDQTKIFLKLFAIPENRQNDDQRNTALMTKIIAKVIAKTIF